MISKCSHSKRVDPYTAESAIATMFTDLPYAAMPSVEADPDMQQLIVHATKPQLERIRQLLEKMGEGTVQQSAAVEFDAARVSALRRYRIDAARDRKNLATGAW